jgi:hypothetical protein
MTGARGCAVTAASRKESETRRGAGGEAVRMRVQVMCVRGISHGFERPGLGLTSPFSGFS